MRTIPSADYTYDPSTEPTTYYRLLLACRLSLVVCRSSPLLLLARMSYRRSAVFRAKLNIQRHCIGFLIGPKGSVIKGLQRKHRIRSRIDQDALVYHLSGNEQDVRNAISDIQKHVNWIKNLDIKAPEPKPTRPKKNQPDSDGWTVCGKARDIAEPKPTKSLSIETSNKFAGFEDSDDEEPQEETKTSPRRRVTFAHDATGEDEIRLFDKDAPASDVSDNSSDEDEPTEEDLAYLASKRSSTNAWRPRSRTTSVSGDSHLKKLNQWAKGGPKPKKTAIKESWADICDEWDRQNGKSLY